MRNLLLLLKVQLMNVFQKYLSKLVQKIGTIIGKNVDMKYPIRLLPQPNFRKIQVPEIRDKYYLLRSTKDKDFIDPITGKIKIEYLVEDETIAHLRDFSTNLLGVFTIRDSQWHYKSSERKLLLLSEWNEGEEGLCPNIPEDIELNTEKGCVFIPINEVHEREVPHRSLNFKRLECKVLHTPIKSNFWHFSIRWYFDGLSKENWTKGIKNLMKTTGRSFLIEVIKFEEPNYIQISQNLYLN